MLSKEEKLKYGEALRQQMREKEQKKRQEDIAKRAVVNVVKSQSDRVIVPDPSLFDQKEFLQKKLQTEEYNPFGKAGGGAPNRRQPNNSAQYQEQNRSAVIGHSSQEHPPLRSYPPEGYVEHPSAYEMPKQRNGTLQTGVNASNQPVYPSHQQPLNYQQAYPLNSNIIQYQHYEPEREIKYLPPRILQPHRQGLMQQPVQQSTQIYQKGPQDYVSNKFPERGQQRSNPNYQPQYYQPTPQKPGLYRQQFSQPQLNAEKNYYGQPPVEGRERIKTLQNQELQEMYKKGGRNLLRLQNETVNEQLVKQKQKQEMHAFLKQQMEEADRRKQQEKEKLRREQLQEQRRNKEYLQRQNQKMIDQERKKVQQKQKLAEQNMRNLAIKKEMELDQKRKVEMQQMQQIERKQREQYEIQQRERQQLQVQQPEIRRRAVERPREDSSSSLSQSSSEPHTYSKGFNTNVSREFVKKQRERDAERGQNDKKLELFTNQIQKMRDEILNQGEMFQQQIEKIKREAQKAQDEKRRADLEVEKLKLQLEKKNKESQLRLLEALKRNDPYTKSFDRPPQQQWMPSQYYPQKRIKSHQYQQQQDEYQRKPVGIPSRLPPSPKKMMTKQNKIYDHPPERQQRKMIVPKSSKNDYNWEKQMKLEESNIGTLDAESKKIPLNLQAGTKLTISGVQNFGKDTFLYGKSEPQPRFMKEEKPFSRSSKRSEKDELDRLIEKNQNKWEMSTVKDDITKEIQELLKKKDNSGQLQPSTIGKVGRQVVSRGALPYEGPALGTLNSNKASLVSDGGTLDIDKIHGRNEARLRQLRALGVETINTTNDDDLNRLNVLLSNYDN